MMEKLLKNIAFEEQCINVKDDIKQSNVPVVLRVKGQCLLSDRWTLADGNTIVIHGRRNIGILNGKDSNGRSITLFTTCPYTVQLALPESERKTFTSLRELCVQEYRPKFVEIDLDNDNEVNESVKNGDRLKVLLVEKGPQGPLFMHFRNEKGKHIRLPVDIKASFTACPPDGKEYFISEIANINKAPLALFIKFIHRKSDKSGIFNSLGTIEITGQSSVEVIYMTVKDNGKIHCCVCPIPEDLCGQIGKGSIDKPDEYETLQNKISELAPVEKFESLHGGYSPLESEGLSILPADKIFLKKKSKEKAKRIESLIVENEEQSSEKKRNSFVALFKDERRKESDGANKKDKNKKKIKKSKEEQMESGSREENGTDLVCENVVTENHRPKQESSIALDMEEAESSMRAVGIDEKESKADILLSKEHKTEEKKKKKTAEDKKKWKFDLKSKLTGNDKKEKKKKIGKGNSLDNQHCEMQVTVDSSSEPCSPGSDVCNDEYEIPDEIEAIAAQNKCPDAAAHKDKGKSSTLISRTWKKMKKRRRALSTSNMQRSHTDTDTAKAETDGYNDESPPAIMDPDYPDEIYEQIPGEFVSQDIYEEAVRTFGAYESSVAQTAEASDSGFDEVDKKQLDTLRGFTVPPPLPGNHPRMPPRPRRGSSLTGDNPRISIGSEGFRLFYESMKRSESQIRTWGPDEIEKALNDLQLGHHAEKFNESQIDGSLLFDLDEAVLRDLGLTLFEARKLRKFVFGWRPDSKRDALYQQKYNRESKNPSHWSTNMVADLITSELGIPDFGLFCRENQVNGDLLRDIVIDEELLGFLLAGKAAKLNAVKLKNFVLDGWRPPKRKETQCEGVDSQSKIGGKESSYEPLSPSTKDAPNTYESVTPTRDSSVCHTDKESKSVTNVTENKKTIASNIGKEKTISHQTSREKTRVTSPSGSVNSLMQKYEKKSTHIDAPRPFTKTSSPRSPGGLGGDNRSGSTLSSVANMKKIFSD